MESHPLDSTASWQITDGMTVYGMDGDKLGVIRNYDPQVDYLDVQKGWLFHKDFYVPTTAVTAVDRDGVTLRVTKQDLDDDRYGAPPLAVGAEVAAPIPNLPEEKLPFDAEREDVTIRSTSEGGPLG